MNFKLVIMLLVVFLGTATARILSLKRTFPGQRIRGATNYGTHAFGANGWVGRPISRLTSRDRNS